MAQYTTDLNERIIGGEVTLIAQPTLTKGMTKESFITQSNKILQDTYESIVQFSAITHVGWALFTNTQSLNYQPCGGGLKLVWKDADGENTLNRKQAGWFLTCSNPECKVDTQFMVPREQHREYFLHLLLKQIFPEAPMMNFLDCSADIFTSILGDPKIETAKAASLKCIGTLGLGYHALHGVVWGDGNCAPLRHYSLAITPVLGMRTSAHSFDGCDRWVAILFNKKLEQLREALKGITPGILGPKQS